MSCSEMPRPHLPWLRCVGHCSSSCYPPSVLRVLGHRRLLRGTLAFLLRPSVSLAVWALVIGAWHIPAAYDYALGHQAVHDVEHLSFLTVGLLVWAQLVNPAHRHRLRASQRLGCMVAMLAFALALGGILVATPPLYPHTPSKACACSGSVPHSISALPDW
jgi:cytochrome c oxidase assembly factor CtaG